MVQRQRRHQRPQARLQHPRHQALRVPPADPRGLPARTSSSSAAAPPSTATASRTGSSARCPRSRPRPCRRPNVQSDLQAFPMADNRARRPLRGLLPLAGHREVPRDRRQRGHHRRRRRPGPQARRARDRDAGVPRRHGRSTRTSTRPPASPTGRPTPRRSRARASRAWSSRATTSSCAKLEQALPAGRCRLVWIDTNTNAYNDEFIELAGDTLDDFANYSAPLIVPREAADENPATQELIDLYEQYAPDATITGPAIQAFSAWLLFATSAAACGADVTRSCVYENASGQTAWDGGGLHAAKDLTEPG